MITPPKTLFDASSLKSAIVFLEITVILHGEQLWGLEKRIRDWMGLHSTAAEISMARAPV